MHAVYCSCKASFTICPKGGIHVKNRLEELRRARGIRQEDVAQALGVSRQTVISLEKGKYNPSLALAFRLSRFFGLPIEEIFDDSDEQAEEPGNH